MRKKANTDFEKTLYDSTNNPFFGYTLEKLRHHVILVLVSHKADERMIRRNTKLPFHGFREHYSFCFQYLKTKLEIVMFNKPIYVCFTVLDISNILTTEFYYNKFQIYWKGKNTVELCENRYFQHKKSLNLLGILKVLTMAWILVNYTNLMSFWPSLKKKEIDWRKLGKSLVTTQFDRFFWDQGPILFQTTT